MKGLVVTAVAVGIIALGVALGGVVERATWYAILGWIVE